MGCLYIFGDGGEGHSACNARAIAALRGRTYLFSRP